MSENAETRRQMLRRACSAVGLSTHGSVDTLVKRLQHGRLPGKSGRKRSIRGNVLVPNEFEISQRTHLAASYITDHDEQTEIIRRMWANRVASERKRDAHTDSLLFWEKLDAQTATKMTLAYLGQTTKNGHTLYEYIPYEPIAPDDGPPSKASRFGEPTDDEETAVVVSDRVVKALEILKGLLTEL